MENNLHNVNIRNVSPLPTPDEIKREYPLSDTAHATVLEARDGIAKILLGDDQTRLLAVVGPCSIHNADETMRYAIKLAALKEELKDRLLIVMRFCGDKPRTGRDWTGFWNDPKMDGSCDIAYGWKEGRKLAVEILNLGLPLGFEFLDAENFQRFDDTPSYVWIGARNVGNQRQRQIASGISAPVGFKNHNTGGVKIAIDAMEVAVGSNVFVASNDRGVSSRFVTNGNRLCHLIHRGTDAGPNYDAASVAGSVHQLAHRGFNARIMVDASHDNSGKDHTKQEGVIAEIVGQAVDNQQNKIVGFMYESYLDAGKQPIPLDLSELKPNISVTDGCDDWPTTERVLRMVYERLV